VSDNLVARSLVGNIKLFVDAQRSLLQKAWK